MKPTLAQLKKRPALWVSTTFNCLDEPRITMPNGDMWMYGLYFRAWTLHRANKGHDWREYALRHYEFGCFI